MEDVFVLSAVRTPIGKYGGGLASVPPCDLAAMVVREAVSRSGADPVDVGHVVFGNVLHTETRDMYLARVAALNGGLEIGTPAMTLNRLCGSGMQAIVSAAQAIMLGDCEVAVAGGAESMSRAPYWLPGMRWGQRMGDGIALDPMAGALIRPVRRLPHGRDRGERGRRLRRVPGRPGRAGRGEPPPGRRRTAAGYFKEQILPVEIPGKRGKVTVVDTDEHIRPDVSLEDMAKLRPAFAKDGTVTAGNASGINDAAAAVVLASGVVRQPQRPAPRWAGWSATRHAGVEPRIMGMGPVPATRNGARPDRPQARRDRRVRGQRGLRRPGAGRGQGTGPAARAHQPERQRHLASATPSAPPGPSWPSSRCTSSSAPAAGTRSPPCASAAARASPRSSSASDTRPG